MDKGIIFTNKSNCQDCYKCVRNCPVKAIKVIDGQATVNSEKCILCGTCVEICPTGAKDYQKDYQKVEEWLKSGEEVYLSIAPSYPLYFKEKTQSWLRRLLKAGFKGISETALGAEIISHFTCQYLTKKEILFSSACPVIGLLLKKYYPNLLPYYAPIYSPLGAHARYLKNKWGKQIKVVFIGPCIAKKWEVEIFSDIDASLTFEESMWLLEDFNLSELSEESSEEPIEFCTEEARYGKLFPVHGGMIKTMVPDEEFLPINYIALDGIEDIIHFLDDFSEESFSKKPVFLEMLSCRDGCINGPIFRKNRVGNNNKAVFLHKVSLPIKPVSEEIFKIKVTREWQPTPIKEPEFSEEEIRKVLIQMGKYRKEDELNCGACGYPTCREHAVAILKGYAEIRMCVSYMRKLAESKANALLKADPNGIVILNEHLEIITMNPAFIKMFKLDENELPKQISQIMPDEDFFEVLTKNFTIYNKMMTFPEIDLVTRVTIFPIENYRIIGAIFIDISDEISQKKEITYLSEITLKKANEVINKQMKTAQEMAKMLGDVTSETKILLYELIKLAEKFRE